MGILRKKSASPHPDTRWRWLTHGTGVALKSGLMDMPRKKTEAKPSRPRYIQTHAGVGYRTVRV